MKEIVNLAKNTKYKRLEVEQAKLADLENEKLNKAVAEIKSKMFKDYWSTIYSILIEEGIYPKNTDFKKTRLKIKDDIVYQLDKKDEKEVIKQAFVQTIEEKLKSLFDMVDPKKSKKKTSKRKTTKKKQGK